MKMTWFVVLLILVLLSAREVASNEVDDLSKDSLGPPPRTDVGIDSVVPPPRTDVGIDSVVPPPRTDVVGPEYKLEGRFEGRKGHGHREKKGNEGPKKGWGGWFGGGGDGKGFEGRFEGPGFKGGFDGGKDDGKTVKTGGAGHP